MVVLYSFTLIIGRGVGLWGNGGRLHWQGGGFMIAGWITLAAVGGSGGRPGKQVSIPAE